MSLPFYCRESKSGRPARSLVSTLTELLLSPEGHEKVIMNGKFSQWKYYPSIH
jgi:hypothetical protein